MQSGVQLPVLSRTNKIIIGAFVATFLLGSILGHAAGISFNVLFGLSSARFFSGHIYQIVTYPFVGSGLIEVIFNGLIFWFIGQELENIWGKKRYLSFIGVSILGGGLIYLLVTALIFGSGMILPLSGMAGAASALLVAYAILYPDRTFLFMLVFPVKAKYFCMLLVGMQLYIGFFSPSASLAWGHLGTILSGFLFMWYLARRKDLFKKPSFMGKKRKRDHLRLVKDDDEKPPKYWN